MANWVNVNLDVHGLPVAVESFRRAAGAKVGRIHTTRSSVFTPEMEYGEGGDLEADPLCRLGDRFRTATYRFQGRNDDHVDHFQAVSRRFPALAFVLAYSDPNGDDHGSYLLRRGRRRTWVVPPAIRNRLLREALVKYGLPADLDTAADDRDEVCWAENDAYFAMIDIASRHWQDAVLDWLARTPPAVVPSRPTKERGAGRMRRRR